MIPDNLCSSRRCCDYSASPASSTCAHSCMILQQTSYWQDNKRVSSRRSSTAVPESALVSATREVTTRARIPEDRAEAPKRSASRRAFARWLSPGGGTGLSSMISSSRMWPPAKDCCVCAAHPRSRTCIETGLVLPVLTCRRAATSSHAAHGQANRDLSTASSHKAASYCPESHIVHTGVRHVHASQ